jgi:hypothetical protein
MTRSWGDQVKLLGKRQLLLTGVLRLLFTHHVNHLHPAQNCPSGCHRLEPKHRPNPGAAQDVFPIER